VTTDRELLAAALRPWVYPDDGGRLYRERMASEMSERIADALLPVVDQIAMARAAAELRAAANDYERGLGTVAPRVPMSLRDFAPWLRARADALDPAAPESWRPQPTPHVCQFCERPLDNHWWTCSYEAPPTR
jgi:hypothetical protein